MSTISSRRSSSSALLAGLMFIACIVCVSLDISKSFEFEQAFRKILLEAAVTPEVDELARLELLRENLFILHFASIAFGVILAFSFFFSSVAASSPAAGRSEEPLIVTFDKKGKVTDSRSYEAYMEVINKNIQEIKSYVESESRTDSGDKTVAADLRSIRQSILGLDSYIDELSNATESKLQGAEETRSFVSSVRIEWSTLAHKMRTAKQML